MMKSKNQKILESFDLSKIDEKKIDKKILESMLKELVTSGIKLRILIILIPRYK